MAGWSVRGVLKGVIVAGRIVEVVDHLSKDTDQIDHDKVRNKLIAPFDTSRRKAGSPIETISSEGFLPPPSRTGQRPFVDGRPPKQSQPSNIPINITTERQARPPLPPRSLGQSDVRSKSVDGTQLLPSPSTKSPSLSLPTPQCRSCAPSLSPPLESQPEKSLHTVSNPCPAPHTSASTTPRSSCDGLSPRQRRSPTGTEFSSAMTSTGVTDLKTNVRYRESFDGAEIEVGAASGEGVAVDGSLGSPELLSFAEKRKHLQYLLSKA
ncbi:MAG: hypothetical protein L6R38_009600 [Xanthoria sp. 2 TBL-2021]|nr:MAG: hypothetical protein L6R38_009600 [Xanthoria sp. 2 TBL-2021]